MIENEEFIVYNEAIESVNILTSNQLICQILLLNKEKQIEI